MQKHTTLVAANIAVALVYAVTGWFGLAFFSEANEHVTLIWPPAGIALAVLILWGPTLLPGVCAGSLMVNNFFGVHPGSTVLIAIGDGSSALIGWWLLTRTGFSQILARSRDVFSLMIFGAFTGPLVSATLGATVLSLDGTAPRDARSVWSDWWLGDAGSVVMFTPLLLLSVRGSPSWWTLFVRGESWALLFATFALGGVIFGSVVDSITIRLVAVFLPYLLIVWAALRLGPRGSMCTAFVASAVAITGRAHGTGPLGEQAHISLLWVYVVTLSLMAFVLASTMTAREASDQAKLAADLEMRNLEEQLRYAQRLEGIGLLAGGIAHDFNNLLLVIRANASLLEPVGPQREFVSEIDNAARQAADLCRQLLTYAGRSSPELISVDLRALADEMRMLLRAHIPASIRIEVDTAVAPAVCADPTQVRQVLMNLILNAAEAISEPGGSITVRTGAMDCDARYLQQTFLHSEAEPGRFAFIEVEDTGCGMDPDTLRRIFDPFFTTKSGGRGLGLTTVAGLVRSHRGAIKVTSVVGRGSLCRLLLPSWDGPAAPARTSMSSAAPHSLEGKVILIADDEPAVLRAAERILKRSGCVVLTAVDGAAAIEIYEANKGRIDAVLLDVSMPEITGPDALARMREMTIRLPAVLMSGNLPDGIDPDASGFRFLAKPFGVGTLIDALDAVIAGKSASPR